MYYRDIESYTVIYWSKTAKDNTTMQAVQPDKLHRVLDKIQQGIQYGVTVQAATQGTLEQEVLEGNPSQPVFFNINFCKW